MKKKMKAPEWVRLSILEEHIENIEFCEEIDVIGPDEKPYTLKCSIGWEIDKFLDVHEGLYEERREQVIAALAPAINRRVRAGVFNKGIKRVKKFDVYHKGE